MATMMIDIRSVHWGASRELKGIIRGKTNVDPNESDATDLAGTRWDETLEHTSITTLFNGQQRFDTIGEVSMGTGAILHRGWWKQTVNG